MPPSPPPLPQPVPLRLLSLTMDAARAAAQSRLIFNENFRSIVFCGRIDVCLPMCVCVRGVCVVCVCAWCVFVCVCVVCVPKILPATMKLRRVDRRRSSWQFLFSCRMLDTFVCFLYPVKSPKELLGEAENAFSSLFPNLKFKNNITKNT